MTQKKEVGGKLEFVTLAGARARQLLAGCTPRSVSNTNKPAKLAQQEVREGKVERSIPNP